MKTCLKQLRFNIKEDIQDFLYFIKTPYFFIRRQYRKVKFFKKMWPLYFAAWDICETVLDFNFELFCNFYEEGDLEIINWNSDKWHKNAKKWFDEIHNYWKEERPKLIKEQERVLHEWNKSSPMKFIDCEQKDCKEIIFEKSKNSDELFNQHTELEQEIENLDKKYLKKIIDLKDYMWT